MAIKDQPEFEAEAQTEDTTATATATTTANGETPMTKTVIGRAPADANVSKTAPAPGTGKVPAQAAAKPSVPAAKKFTAAFTDIQDAFPIEAVAGLSLATPRIKGEQGAAYIKEESLGSKFRFEVESWNHRWLLSAGTNDAEAKDYLKTSYDQETIYNEGMTCTEYLDHLKELGFEKAKMAHYIDIWGFVTWTEDDGDIAPEERTLHIIQASQTSAGAFDAYRITQGLLRSKGVGVESNIIEVHAMARSKGSNKYTNFDFMTPKA